MASYVLLLLATTTVLVVLLWSVVRVARKPLDRTRGEDRAPSASDRSFLVDNWAHIQETALQHGMTSQELAGVRKKLFAS